MVFLDKLKNYKLKYKEKCSNLFYRQVYRAIRMLLKYPLKSYKNGILKVMIGLTYECQCDCEYCCSGLYVKEKSKQLTVKEIKHLIDTISELPFLGVLISFFGGEPLTREDIFDLVKYAVRKGLFTEVETNGILLSLQTVKKLKKSGLHHLFVRIEHNDPKMHDCISKYRGCFKKATEGIRHCVKNGLSCSISTIATKEKIYNNQLKKILDLGKRLKVASIRILYPTLSGKWIKKTDQVLTKKEEKIVSKLLKPDFVYLESSDVCVAQHNRICPSKQKKKFYISCYGEIQPCPFVPIIFGDIRDEKMSVILNKMWKHPIFHGKGYNGCIMNDLKTHEKYFNNSESNTLYSKICF